MLIIAHYDDDIRAELVQFLSERSDGVHASAPLRPFDFRSFIFQARFVRQALALAIPEQVPLVGIEHQWRPVGHGHAADEMSDKVLGSEFKIPSSRSQGQR